MLEPRLPVFQGRNVWRLVRGNVDEPDPESLPQKAAAFVRWVFQQNRTGTPELVPVGPDEWRFGDVRPLRVLSVSDDPQPMPPGKLMGDRETVPGVAPAVRLKQGTTPKFVLLEFWWRGSPTETVPYPAWQKGLLGPSYTLTGADWLLDKAVWDDDADDPGDESWAEAQGENVTNIPAATVRAAAKMFGRAAGVTLALQGGLLFGGLYLYLKSRDKT